MFERPGLHLLVVAVQEGALCSRTLHIIHMDQSCACRVENAHDVDLKPFITQIKSETSAYMGGLKRHVLFQATH